MGFIKISCCWCHRDSGCTSLDVVISTKKKLFKKSLKFKREKHFKANRPFLLPSFYCSRKKLFNYAQLKSWQERCNLISFNKSLQFHRRWRKSFFFIGTIQCLLIIQAYEESSSDLFCFFNFLIFSLCLETRKEEKWAEKILKLSISLGKIRHTWSCLING